MAVLKNPDKIYFKALSEVLKNEKDYLDNRTATQTIRTVGYTTRYDLSDSYYEAGALIMPNFPLFTTKKLSFKNIYTELLWLINGQTNIYFLEKNNNTIWRDWPLRYYNQNSATKLSEKEFSKAIAEDIHFAKRWGELGPVYGKQWRAWENIINGSNAPIDQLALMMETLRKSPSSRRNIVTAWNPPDIPEMSISGLPPCHWSFQAVATPCSYGYVLDLVVNIRSCNERLH